MFAAGLDEEAETSAVPWLSPRIHPPVLSRTSIVSSVLKDTVPPT